MKKIAGGESAVAEAKETITKKARTVITTDGEVDDMNSVLRFLLYANEMDIEGIVATSSVYHYAGDKEAGIEPYRWTGTDWLYNMLDAYEEAYPNLTIHDEGYPEPEYLRENTKIGNISNAGEMEKITEGSEFLKELFLDDDDSDLYVQTWGGTNTTARALKSIQEDYEDTEYAWKDHTDEVNSRFQGEWNYENIKNGHGTLMEMYALMGDGNIIEGELDEEQRGSEEYLANNPQYNMYDFISEGDSPSFFYLINNGLRSLEDPSYGGWGGRFGVESDKLYKNTVLDYDPFTKRYESEYTLMRWFDDIQDDFAARADWVTASNYEDANHRPTVTVEEGLDLEVEKGEEVTLHASATDPDGDNLTYRWWRYFEADTYEDSAVEPLAVEEENEGDLLLGLHRNLAEGEELDTIKLSGSDADTVTFTVPDDSKSGDTIHIIIEVEDDGDHRLKHYQRVILTVK